MHPKDLLIDNLAFSSDFLKARAEHMFSRADSPDRAPANARAEFRSTIREGLRPITLTQVKRKLGFLPCLPLDPRKIRVGFALNTMDVEKVLKMS
jgi:hypothetical protein